MAKEANISFIPKKPLARDLSADKRPISLFAVVSIIIMVLVSGAYGTVFYFTRTIQNNITTMQGQLEKFNQEFDKTIIQKAKSVQNRIDAAKGILDRHIALSPVFELLERVTLKSIQFTKFDYGAEQGETTLSLSGTAGGFASLAYQRDVFLKEVKELKSFTVTEFNLEEEGGVVFDAEAVFMPDAVKYSNINTTPTNNLSTGGSISTP